MNFKQMFLGGLATAGLGFLWVACSSNATGSSCVLGAESCGCKAAEQCDTGLVCFSQRLSAEVADDCGKSKLRREIQHRLASDTA